MDLVFNSMNNSEGNFEAGESPANSGPIPKVQFRITGLPQTADYSMLMCMQKVAKPRGKKVRRWIVLASALLLWFGGAAGWLVRTVALQVVPQEGRYHRIRSIGTGIVADPATGAVVRVSAPRLLSLAREAIGWKALVLPPGTLPAWLTLDAELRVRLSDEAPEVWMPVVFRIVPDLPHPVLTVRLPSDMVNEALAYEGSFAHREKTRRYALGHYSMIHWLKFDTARLTSKVPDRVRNRSITFRRIEGSATGQVRFKVEENWFDARTTARVRQMDLRCDLDFQKFVDGLSLSYKITIRKLDADINNLAPIFERRPVEAIRVALEDSIARPKNLDRLARRRLPLYIPLDTDLDIEVFSAGGP